MYLPVFTTLSFLPLLGYFLSCAPQTVLGAPTASTQIGTRTNDFPGPPDPPKQTPGDGSGPYNVAKPEPSDQAVYDTYRDRVGYADSIGFDNAARTMSHYLDNVGTELIIYPENIMDDISQFNKAVVDAVQQPAKKAFADAKVGSGIKQTFVSGWSSFNTQGLDKDWFLAIGGFSYSVTGVVQTQKVGNDWTGELWWAVYIFDRYNWDAAKGDIGVFGLPIFSCSQLAKLHTVGLAKEYDVRGASNIWNVKLYTGGDVPEPTLKPTDDEFEG